MSKRCFAHFGILAGAALLTLAATNSESAELRGSVTYATDGSALPGVEIVVSNGGREWKIYTGLDGQYELVDLPRGLYVLRAKLQGFRTVTRTDVQVPVAGTVVVNFSMRLAGPLETVMWVMPEGGLLEAYRSADAIVHLQITRSLDPSSWRVDRSYVVGTKHVAIVLDVLNEDPEHGATFGSELRFVQYPAGTYWDHGFKTAEGIETPYSPGEEYVAFLDWEPRFKCFTRFIGPVFMLPVLDGRVSLDRMDVDVSVVPELREGMRVEVFLAALRDLSHWQQEER